jgi:hypothetical protein
MQFTGDWQRAQQILATAAKRIDRALHQAILQEAHRIRADMVKGLVSGAPAGRRFAPHSPVTLLIRKGGGFGGSKVLVHRGDLLGSIVVVPLRPGAAFVGVKRRSGKGVDIARLHEFGKTYRMRPGQRRFIFAHLRKAGIKPVRRGGGSTVTIRVPPRPFIGPIVESVNVQAMKRRIERAVMAALR